WGWGRRGWGAKAASRTCRPSRSSAASRRSASLRAAPARAAAPPSRPRRRAPMSKRRAPESAPADGFRCGEVAGVGRPNVGKSTLINTLVGARISITSKRPQTTRHRIRGILTTATAQFIFVDTPGFQTEHRSALNARMNRAVRESVAGVDAIVLVVEPPALTREDRDVAALLPAAAPVIAAVNKA